MRSLESIAGVCGQGSGAYWNKRGISNKKARHSADARGARVCAMSTRENGMRRASARLCAESQLPTVAGRWKSLGSEATLSLTLIRWSDIDLRPALAGEVSREAHLPATQQEPQTYAWVSHPHADTGWAHGPEASARKGAQALVRDHRQEISGTCFRILSNKPTHGDRASVSWEIAFPKTGGFANVASSWQSRIIPALAKSTANSFFSSLLRGAQPDRRRINFS